MEKIINKIKELDHKIGDLDTFINQMKRGNKIIDKEEPLTGKPELKNYFSKLSLGGYFWTGSQNPFYETVLKDEETINKIVENSIKIVESQLELYKKELKELVPTI